MNEKTALRLCCAGILLSIGLGTTSSATTAVSLDSAAERYRPELAAAVEQCLTGAQTMRERIVAKDIEGGEKGLDRFARRLGALRGLH